MIPIRIYQGRFSEEHFLFEIPSHMNYTPSKGDFLFHHGTSYKILYIMLDVDDDEYIVFVREAVEEDF